MALDDFAEPEVAVAAAVAAAIFSPRARQIMRKGLVYGMAGILVVGDSIASFSKSVGRGVQKARATAEGQPTAQGTQAGGEPLREEVRQ